MTQTALPQSSHIILDHSGRVAHLQTWCNWNGTDWPVTTIKRQDDGTVFIDNGDPEHGGFAKTTETLDEAVACFHPTIRERYHKLFALTNPTAAQLAALDFRNHEIFPASALPN